MEPGVGGARRRRQGVFVGTTLLLLVPRTGLAEDKRPAQPAPPSCEVAREPLGNLLEQSDYQEIVRLLEGLPQSCQGAQDACFLGLAYTETCRPEQARLQLERCRESVSTEIWQEIYEPLQSRHCLQIESSDALLRNQQTGEVIRTEGEISVVLDRGRYTLEKRFGDGPVCKREITLDANAPRRVSINAVPLRLSCDRAGLWSIDDVLLSSPPPDELYLCEGTHRVGFRTAAEEPTEFTVDADGTAGFRPITLQCPGLPEDTPTPSLALSHGEAPGGALEPDEASLSVAHLWPYAAIVGGLSLAGSGALYFFHTQSEIEEQRRRQRELDAAWLASGGRPDAELEHSQRDNNARRRSINTLNSYSYALAASGGALLLVSATLYFASRQEHTGTGLTVSVGQEIALGWRDSW